ncbi:N-acetylmuramoyl-L-alanine amidase [Thermoleophilum album]|uniref:N-acetylmuramoyl-L-alanine amidase n=1 Tax=Thermoleophilum album TaxID=29539 RepID=UPI0015A5ADBB|nr:N-acetylmuramoyl-L-alanine amidase [Thermoleophilum album]
MRARSRFVRASAIALVVAVALLACLRLASEPAVSEFEQPLTITQRSAHTGEQPVTARSLGAPQRQADPRSPRSTVDRAPRSAVRRAQRPVAHAHDHDAALSASQEVVRDARPLGRYATPPIETRRSFDLVGLRWRGPARRVWLRARLAGGRWTPWARVDADDAEGPDLTSPEANKSLRHSLPAWAGGADAVEVRADRPLLDGHLHFVTTGRSGLRAAVATVGSWVARIAAPLARLFSPSAAHADSQPAIVPREQWAGDQCRPRRSPAYGTVKAAVIHHTVTLNDYSPDEAPQIVLAICRYHVQSNGWNDIGYNFLVDRYGRIYEGRAGGVEAAVVGAHAQGYNAQTTGIAELGTFDSDPQTEDGLRATAALIRWKLPIHGVPTSGTAQLESAGGSESRYTAGTVVTAPRVAGHRDLGKTSCPGDALYGELAQLRALVGDVPATTAGVPTAEVRVPRSLVTYGQPVTVGGTLQAPDGSPLAGTQVRLETLVARRWRTIIRVTSDAAGRWRARLRPRSTLVLRVRVPAQNGFAELLARTFTLRVRPRIVSSLRGSRSVYPHTVVRVRGRISPTSSTTQFVVLRAVGKGRRRVAVIPLQRDRSGRFGGAWRAPGRAGRYFLYVSARAPGLAWGRSEIAELSVVPGVGGGTLAPARSP